MNFYKISFLFLVMIGPLISISSYTWLGVWMGLEMNLLAIIPLMINMNNKISSEVSMKYYISQALASMILMFSILLLLESGQFISKILMNLKFILLNSALLMKLGAAPFHFWFPEVMEGLSWYNCLIFLTWQKLAPMILIMFSMKMKKFFYIIIIICMLISGIMAFNQTSLRKILTYSSINHIGWMISSMLYSELMWIFYYFFYFLINICIIMILNYYNIFYFSQFKSLLKMNFLLNMFFMLNFFSLAGLPPFMGFIPKWLIINKMVDNQLIFIPLIMILFTMIMIFVYIQMMINTLLIMSMKQKFLINMKFMNFIFIMLNFLVLFMIIFCPYLFNWM